MNTRRTVTMLLYSVVLSAFIQRMALADNHNIKPVGSNRGDRQHFGMKRKMAIKKLVSQENAPYVNEDRRRITKKDKSNKAKTKKSSKSTNAIGSAFDVESQASGSTSKTKKSSKSTIVSGSAFDVKSKGKDKSNKKGKSNSSNDNSPQISPAIINEANETSKKSTKSKKTSAKKTKSPKKNASEKASVKKTKSPKVPSKSKKEKSKKSTKGKTPTDSPTVTNKAVAREILSSAPSVVPSVNVQNENQTPNVTFSPFEDTTSVPTPSPSSSQQLAVTLSPVPDEVKPRVEEIASGQNGSGSIIVIASVVSISIVALLAIFYRKLRHNAEEPMHDDYS